MKENNNIRRIYTYTYDEGDVYGVKNRLREIRMREYMMAPGEFAEYIGSDIKNYSNWERNISRPNLEKSLEIAKKLNKRVDDIWYLE